MLVLLRIGRERLAVGLLFLFVEGKVIVVVGLIGAFHHAHPYFFQFSFQVDAMLALLLELLQERLDLFISLLLQILILPFVLFGLVLNPALLLFVFLDLAAEMFDPLGILLDFGILCIEFLLHFSNLLTPICIEATHAA